MNLIKKMLAAPVAVLALWAVNAQATTDEEIAARIKPVGEVCIAGEECKGVGEVAAVAAGGGMSAADVVKKYCSACHGAAAAAMGAPAIGDSPAWQKRQDEAGGFETLLAHAISGIRTMPPKGTCATCSDEDLEAAIHEMSGL